MAFSRCVSCDDPRLKKSRMKFRPGCCARASNLRNHHTLSSYIHEHGFRVFALRVGSSERESLALLWFYWSHPSHLNRRPADYVMINAYWEALPFAIQEWLASDWRVAVDASRPIPNDIFTLGTEPSIAFANLRRPTRSIVVLLRN